MANQFLVCLLLCLFVVMFVCYISLDNNVKPLLLPTILGFRTHIWQLEVELTIYMVDYTCIYIFYFIIIFYFPFLLGSMGGVADSSLASLAWD
jgi:hypothetical protein